MAPPSISQPGRRAVAAQRVKAEASYSDQRETGGAQINVVVAENTFAPVSHTETSGLKTTQFPLTFKQEEGAFQSGI